VLVMFLFSEPARMFLEGRFGAGQCGQRAGGLCLGTRRSAV